MIHLKCFTFDSCDSFWQFCQECNLQVSETLYYYLCDYHKRSLNTVLLCFGVDIDTHVSYQVEIAPLSAK